MKINVRKLAKINDFFRTIIWLSVALWLSFNAFRCFLSIKSDLEGIKAIQIIQLNYSKQFMDMGE